ncbi:hypothetical protein TIFTF001_033789 [Ficus carica]|uniref:Uncharacterized protein n=1 Tax=Ficus carica TaxID=3494 RepID=A0AA88J8B0_FICCA|nr:hypothetical protein TIFTF001_033789 [Ficus carica]
MFGIRDCVWYVAGLVFRTVTGVRTGVGGEGSGLGFKTGSRLGFRIKIMIGFQDSGNRVS